MLSAQINLTTRCNSNCYYCLTEELKRMNIKTPKQDLPINVINTLVDQGVTNIHLCGTRGESIFHPKFDTIIDILKNNNIAIRMNTNGAKFDPTWWYQLGKRLEPTDEIVFALDGLNKEHSYYRGTDFDYVINNAKAFIRADGFATWKMITFKHNEDQVVFAKGLSRAMGFKRFMVTNSRAYGSKFERPVKIYNKNRIDILEEQTDPISVSCRFPEGEKIYVAIDSTVWPCCVLRNLFLSRRITYLDNVFEEEKHFINLLNTPLSGIMNNSKLFRTVYDQFPNDECKLYCNSNIGLSRQVLNNI